MDLENDQKGNAHSVKASANLSEGNIWHNFRVYLEGSAINEWSAKMNLVEAVEQCIVQLQKLCKDIKYK